MVKKHFKQYKVLYIIVILASILILYNFDSMYLWKDEASTAQIGYNTMLYGYPQVWDGKNLVTNADGSHFNDHFVEIAHGWLQYYIAGISIKLLGKTTFAARLPFTLFSIFTIVVIWFLAKKVFRRESIANLTAFTFSIYIPFLLYSRQCRYYPLVFFFCSLSLLMLYKLFDYYEQKKEYTLMNLMIVRVFLSISFALLFYSDHLSGFVLIGGIVSYLILVKPFLFRKIILNIGFGILLWSPWYIYANVLSNTPTTFVTKLDTNFAVKILMVVWKIHAYLLPFLIMIGFVLILRIYSDIVKKPKRTMFTKQNIIFVFILISNIIIVAAPRQVLVNHYLLCAVVAAPFILTTFIYYVYKHSKLFSIILYTIIISCNLFNIAPYFLMDKDFKNTNNSTNNYLSMYNETTNRFLVASPVTLTNLTIEPLKKYLKNIKIESYFLNYLKELTNDYDCPAEEITKTLMKYGSQDETVFIMGGEFECEPIIFYTKLRVVKNLNEKFNMYNNTINQKKYSYLTYAPDQSIDWIILMQGYNTFLFDDPGYLEKSKSEYDIFESKSIDIPMSNIPDLDYHKFTTVTDGPKFIFMHRKSIK